MSATTKESSQTGDHTVYFIAITYQRITGPTSDTILHFIDKFTITVMVITFTIENTVTTKILQTLSTEEQREELLFMMAVEVE